MSCSRSLENADWELEGYQNETVGDGLDTEALGRPAKRAGALRTDGGRERRFSAGSRWLPCAHFEPSEGRRRASRVRPVARQIGDFEPSENSRWLARA